MRHLKMNSSICATNCNEHQTNLTDKQLCLHQLFERQASLSANKTALVFGERHLSYQTLERLANQLSHCLIEKNRLLNGVEVGVDATVILMLPRTELMVISILAVLKTGAAYVPVDPDFPAQRIDHIIDDIKPALVITAADFEPKQADWTHPSLFSLDLAHYQHILAQYPDTPPEVEVSPQQLAYVLYTSGTTGQPKGVMIQHQAVTNTLISLEPIYGDAPHSAPSKISAFTHFVFDVSISECFATLVFGNELHLLSDAVRADSIAISDYILEQQLNVVYLPPAVLAVLPRVDYDSIKAFIFAGEPCQSEVGAYFASRYALYNFYGPTEATIYATGTRVYADNVNEIGVPLANMKAYVVDPQGRLAAKGDAGELYLSGIGLAMGYSNLPRQTDAVFVHNPFITRDEQSAGFERMYQTGDLVRALPNGNFEYLGRCDQQLKVNGFRIEPGEIECQMASHPWVEQVAVIADKRSGRTRLVAGYVAAKPLDDMKQYLRNRLPEYMVPNQICFLEKMPLAISGKVDGEALIALCSLQYAEQQEQQQAEQQQAKQSPILAVKTPMQSTLQAIFANVLQRPNLSTDADFYQSGGDSIGAMHICSLLHKQGIRCTPRMIFVGKTIDALALKLGQGTCERRALKSTLVNDGQFNEMQQLILNHQLSASLVMYNENITLDFNDQTPTISQLNHALTRLVNHHYILRMQVNPDNLGYRINDTLGADAQLLQVVYLIDNTDDEIKQQLKQAVNQPFDLYQGPLFRFVLLSHQGKALKLAYIHHHLLTDGEAMYNIFVPQLHRLIGLPDAVLPETPKHINLPASVVPSNDFIATLNRIDLFNSSGRDHSQTDGDFEVKVFSPKLSELLIEGAARYQVSVFTLLLSGLNVLLYKFSNNKAITIGGVRSLRDVDSSDVYGNYLANEIYQCAINPEQSAADFIASTFDIIAQQLESPLDYGGLIKAIRQVADVDEKLPNVFMTMEPKIRHDIPWTISQNHTLPNQVKYPLYFEFDLQQQLSLRVEYRTGVFDRGQVNQLIGGFEQILQTLLEQPACALKEVQPCTTAKIEQTVNRFKPTVTLEQGQLVGAFDHNVSAFANNTALIFEGQRMTYAQLNQQANQLANLLVKRYEIGAEMLVALLLEPSFDTIIAILAVLKAGGAYVPVAPAYPQDRIDYILGDTQSPIVITRSDIAAKRLAQLDSKVQVISLDENPQQNFDVCDPQVQISPQQLAYVIYTSGSTGRPKGVMLTHANVHRLFASAAEHFDFTENDVWSLFHSYVFDFSVWEIWGSMLHGGTLVIPNRQQTRDTGAFFELAQQYGLTVLNQTPSAFYNFLHEAGHQAKLTELRYVVFGGEALNLVQLLPWFEQYGYEQPTLVNMYGITETTVHVTYKAITASDIGERSTIGTPLSDLGAYILDEHLQVVPEGVVGELYICGGGLARGYLNQPQLTEERFIANPFVTSLQTQDTQTDIQTEERAQQRLYKTGDLVRLLGDGGIEYVGRSDFQVKIRGYRIELGEIEAILSAHSDVNQSVVLAKTRDSGKQLVGYYVSPQPLDSEALAAFIGAQVPDYMVPWHFVHMAALPLTINGKVDLAQLPEPILNLSDYQPPSSEEERAVCQIWANVLSLDKVGVTDDFFRIGGDSINAIRVVSSLKTLGLAVKVRDIFQYKTIRQLVQQVQTVDVEALQPQYVPFSLVDAQPIQELQRDTLTDIFPATHLQQGMIVECIRDGRIYHNLEVNKVPLVLDRDKFVGIWQALVNKHQLLRARYVLHGDHGYLTAIEKNLDVNGFVVEYQNYQQAWQGESDTPIKLDKAGLFRLALIPDEQSFTFIFTSHHAIEDGWSVASLMAEFIDAYSNDVTPQDAQSLHFGQYVAQELTVLADPAQKAFWQQYLQDLPQTPQKLRSTPVSAHEPVMFEVGRQLEPALVTQVQQKAIAHGVAEDSIFLAAFVRLLKVFYNSDDITLGVVVNNRLEVAGGDSQFGLHLNTMPLRIKGESDNFIDAVFQEKLMLMDHKIYPYGQIKSDLGYEPDEDIYQAAFNYIHFYQKQDSLQTSGAQLVDAVALTNIPLALVANRNGEQFELTFQSHSRYVEKALLVYIADFYYHYLQQLVSEQYNTDRLIPGERELLLGQMATGTGQALCDNKTTVVDLWEQAASDYSANIALCFGDEQLRFDELDNTANRLAHYLVETQGVGCGDIVAIAYARSSQMIVAMLAVMKAGAAYVPVDPEYPPQRIHYIVSDCGAKVLLSNIAGSVKLTTVATDVGIELVNSAQVELQGYSHERLDIQIKADALANLIYTSGTTGNPKGVMVRHSGIVNLARCQRDIFDLSPRDNVMQFASISFDAASWEIYSTLCFGATLVVCSQDNRTDADGLMRLIEREAVSIATLPPVLVETLDEQRCNKLRVLVVAGETTAEKTMNRFSKVCRVINAYGPTETTVCCTYKDYQPGVINTNIGRALANTRIYILDEQLQPVPKGVAGKLYVSGAGIAKGYFNLPELTAERFIDNPLASDFEWASGWLKLYDTGDMARFTMDGDVEYLGRTDFQVKIRGYRIELAEIEQSLSNFNGIGHTSVQLQSHNGVKMLTAYFTAKGQSLQDQLDRIDDWLKVYDSEYSRFEQDLTLNLADFEGWNSSFESKPIELAQMTQWRDATIDSIRQLKPQKVLEIGSGSGLIFYPLLAECEQYFVSDFSRAAVDKLKYGAEQLGLADKAQFVVCDAQKVADVVKANGFVPDTIIINSVAQYFPSMAYLMSVIEQLTDLMPAGGQIFFGDIRDADLLSVFHYDIQQVREPLLAFEQLSQLASQAQTLDKELLIAPTFFHQLGQTVKGITTAAVYNKTGDLSSEMTDYRYDVVLGVNQAQSSEETVFNVPHVLNVQAYRRDLALDILLASDDVVLITDAPNSRVYRQYIEFYNLVCDYQPKEVADWQQWQQLASEHNKVLTVGHCPGSPHLMNLYFSEQPLLGSLPSVTLQKSSLSLSHFVREPVVEIDSAELKAHLAEHLPEYLIPSHFIQLEKFVLTINGKLDRKALPMPQMCSADYQAPQTELEQMLCQLWQTTLSIGRLGVHDDFFQIGGNSILAITLCHRMSQALEHEINVGILFKCKTIAGLISDGLYLHKNTIEVRDCAQPPLSFAQQRLWFIEQYEQGTHIYTIPIALVFDDLDKVRLTTALQRIIERHQVLRTCFVDVVDEGQIQKEQTDESQVRLTLLPAKDFAMSEFTLAQSEWLGRIEEDICQVFDLQNDFPIKATIYRGKEATALLINIHHIAFDGWSVDLFLRELQALLSNEDAALPMLPIQYKDFALWQRDYLADGELARQLDHWREQLAGFETLALPLDKARPAQLNHQGKNLNVQVSGQTARQLKTLARNNGVTLYTLMLATFNVLLHKYSGQSDIVIGAPVANRTSSETQNLIGFFVNAQPMRNTVDSSQNFEAFVANVHQSVIKAQSNQDIPFETLVDELAPERDQSRHPIFQVMFSLQNFGETTLNSDTYQQLDLSDIYHVAKYDLTLFITDSPQKSQGAAGLKALFNYSVALFDDATIERMSRHYMQLLADICEQPKATVASLNLLSRTEQQALTGLLNKPHQSRKLPGLVNRFEQLVQHQPLQTALRCNDETLNYQQLSQRVNLLAGKISASLLTTFSTNTDCKDKAQPRVVILMDRSIDMLVSIIAVLKAGAAYVPLDPETPQARIQFILGDTAASLLLTQHKLLDLLPSAQPVDVLAVDTVDWSEADVTLSQITITAQSLAYVIYTSGTTGQPKGVMLRQESADNYIANLQALIRPGMKVDFSSSLAFDLSVTTTLAAMLLGAEVVIFDQSIKYVDAYRQHLAQHKIEFAKLVPSLAELVFDGETDVKVETLLLGGEKLLEQQVDSLSRHCTTLFDEYGPTEATVGCCLSQRYPQKDHGIGSPYDNTRVYVLDDNLQPVAQGLVGQLYISGIGLAVGYQNQPELTELMFIANPFVDGDSEDGLHYRRLYKSGDRVRIVGNNQLEYLGRGDNQVKLRGFRIELFEIEQQLLNCQGIEQAAVALKQTDSRQWLAAYYVAMQQVDQAQLLSTLKQTLPHYMVPNQLVALPSLPLSASGKLDRQALPTVAMSQEVFESPANETEQTMAVIWKRLLKLDKLSITDNFFRVGGDSILSITLVSQLRKAGFSLTVKDIFSHSTVKALATYILSGQSQACVLARQGALDGDFELLPVQKRFFDAVNDGLISEPNHWNQSFFIRVPKLDVARLERAINGLVQHHDMLTIRFEIDNDNGHARQSYQPTSMPIKLNQLDITGLNDDDITGQLNSWQSGFDLSSGQIFCAGYLDDRNENDAAVFISCHHLAIDAVSWNIIAQDLQQLYQQQPLPLKTTSFGQWVDVVGGYCAAEKAELDHWLNVCESDKSVIALKKCQTQQQTCTEVTFTSQLTKSLLHHANKAFNTQINDLLLCALGGALKSITGCSHQLVTMEGHGREDLDHLVGQGDDLILDTSRTVGWFTTHYPVLLPLVDSVDESLADSIRTVKEQLRTVTNKGVGFGAFNEVDQRLSLPPVVFNYLGVIDSGADDHGKTDEQWSIELDTLSIGVSEQNRDDLIVNINGAVANDVLSFTVESRLEHDTHLTLCSAFEAQITQIVALCVSDKSQKPQLSPSDVGLQLPLAYFDQLQQNPGTELIFPANSLQQGFIFHSVAFADDDAYRVQFLIDYDEVSGEVLDVALYRQAWLLLIRQYPVLRTRFDWQHTPLQVVETDAPLDFSLHDFSDNADVDSAIELLQRQDRAKPFDLQKAGLFRVHLIKRGVGAYTLLRSEHHAISDGWSNSVLMARLHQVYRQLSRQEPVNVPTENGYIDAQRYYIDNRVVCGRFWQEKMARFEGFNDVSPMLSVGTDLSRHHKVDVVKQSFISLDSSALQALAQKHAVTLNAMLQFAWHRLIVAYTDVTQSVVGTTVSGRGIDVPGIEQSVGLFINTLPLILDWDNDNTVLQQLKQINLDTALLNTYSYQNLAQLQSGGSRIFQSVLVHENYPDSASDNDDSLAFEYRAAFEKLDYPLAVTVQEQGSELTIGLTYDADLIFEHKALQLLAQMEQILLKIPYGIHQPHGKLCYLSPAQRFDVLVKGNQTEVAAQSMTIEQVFYQTAQQYGDNTALVYRGGVYKGSSNEETLTYTQLNQRSNRLAHYLQANLSLAFDDRIMICMDRSINMIIAVLAVLKAGAAYVPVDPQSPAARLAFIVEDTSAKAVLVGSEAVDLFSEIKASNTPCNLMVIDVGQTDTSDCLITDLSNELPCDRLAYVIYTSGTTGQPKGVMVEHCGVVNVMDAQVDILGLTGQSRVLQFSNLVFDASVFEIFPAFQAGAVLYLIDRQVQSQLSELKAFIRDNRITCTFISTALMKILGEIDNTSLEVIHTGGESLEGLAALPPCRLINQYGPTEASVYCTQTVIENINSLPIGKPIRNTQIFVLDRHAQPVEKGMIGELYIGGIGVARGYLNQPELTSQVFIDNPLMDEPGLERAYPRLYKTGDRVRLLDSGDYEYIGRTDFQVKVRGFRIEPGEVESRMGLYPGITQSLVLAKSGPVSDNLVGYFCVKSCLKGNGREAVDTDAFKAYLAEHLPGYMVPTLLIEVAQFSLTGSGKINRQDLPEPVWPQLNYVPPENDTQQQLCELFSQVLGIEKVSVMDDFFSLGGNSILAISLCQRISETLGQECRVFDLFENNSVAKLDELLSQSSACVVEMGEF
jgi:amino acid adenylation domain-containing protein/non-ribosomal peptide synthase protein (TIGR01720 family)